MSPWIRTDGLGNGWTRLLIEQHTLVPPPIPPLSDVTTEWINLDSGAAILLMPIEHKKQFAHLNAFAVFHMGGTDVRPVTGAFLVGLDARYYDATLSLVHARCAEAIEIRLSTH